MTLQHSTRISSIKQLPRLEIVGHDIFPFNIPATLSWNRQSLAVSVGQIIKLRSSLCAAQQSTPPWETFHFALKSANPAWFQTLPIARSLVRVQAWIWRWLTLESPMLGPNDMSHLLFVRVLASLSEYLSLHFKKSSSDNNMVPCAVFASPDLTSPRATRIHSAP